MIYKAPKCEWTESGRVYCICVRAELRIEEWKPRW